MHLKKSKTQKVFLIGICGSGMSALASMLNEKGFKVSGSDMGAYPPASDIIEKLNIPFYTGWKSKNITPDIDLVVIGNVCRKDNPEVLKTHELGLPYTSFADAIRDFFIEDRESIVISGTHGKSTTTALVSWILECSGEAPSFMLGGVPLNFKKTYQLTDSKYFVIEGDEYDSAYFQKNPKFLHYRPKHLLINSIEFDHLDIYPNKQCYEDAFKALLELLPKTHTLFANNDSQTAKKLIQKFQNFTPLWYSTSNEKSDWFASNINFSLTGSRFDVFFKGELFESFTSPMIGNFNVSNSLSAIALTYSLGIGKKDIKKALSTFKGLKRRQELIGKLNGGIVIEDFAHHPTAVREVLTAFSKIEDRNKVWAVFEPRSATTRRKIFEEDMIDALSRADNIIIPDPPDRGDIPKEELFDSSWITSELIKRGHECHNITDVDKIVLKLRERVKKRDIVVIMSNGAFGGIYKKLLK